MTEPLISADCDLRDFDFMPLFGDRLFKSETWILCDDAERVAALRLWWASWHEEPAGSLPANDRLLADLAGYGVAVKQFLSIKASAMRGWVICSDGRLYHPVICQIAADTFTKKRKKAADNLAERERKARKRNAVPADKPHLSGGHDPGHPAENALKGERREEDEEPPVAPQGAAPPDPPDIVDDSLDLPSYLDRRPQSVIDAWNAMAVSADLPRVQALTETRRKLILARFPRGLGDAAALFERVGTSRKLRGETNGQGHEGWRASFDWVLTERNFVKICEGNYDDRPGDRSSTSQFRNGALALVAEADRRAERRDG